MMGPIQEPHSDVVGKLITLTLDEMPEVTSAFRFLIYVDAKIAAAVKPAEMTEGGIT